MYFLGDHKSVIILQAGPKVGINIYQNFISTSVTKYGHISGTAAQSPMKQRHDFVILPLLITLFNLERVDDVLEPLLESLVFY